MKTQIQFINHASVLISSGTIGLLSDPWYEGEVFHKGWNLLVEHTAELIEPLLECVTHIWVSHEHPDHFSVRFFNSYSEILNKKNIKILFQKTEDGRVNEFLRSRNLELIELTPNKKFFLAENFEITCIRDGFYDSALLVSTSDLKILNLNDCEVTTESRAKQIKKITGEIDVLLSQFSYAAWKGGIANLNWRKTAAEQKIKILMLQVKMFKPKFLLPFASFVYFSNPKNFYLNDSINNPELVMNSLRNVVNVLVMKPFDIFSEKWDESHSIKALYYWSERYSLKEPNQNNAYKIVHFDELHKNFGVYKERIGKKNDIFFLQTIKMYSPMKVFEPITVYLDDLNIVVVVDIFNEKLLKLENASESDLVMSSESLNFLFKNSFGFDTLTVNGCFEEGKKGGFLKASKTLALESFNNLGFSFGWKLIFNIKLIRLFLIK